MNYSAPRPHFQTQIPWGKKPSNLEGKPQPSRDLFEGFSRLNFEQRLMVLLQAGFLTPELYQLLRENGSPDLSLAENLIENVIGYFHMPMGVVPHMIIDDEEYVVPMAVEETSIVAACSKTAKWIKKYGRITTQTWGSDVIGQIQIATVKSVENLKRVWETHASRWVELANAEVIPSMVQRGGGVRRIDLRFLERPDGPGMMGVFHVYVDVCDAMGANIVNQVCEYLKTPIEQASGEKVTMCILSNLVDSRVTQAKVYLEGLDDDLVYRIQEASFFAESDPYRAATHNKGVMNGIDAVLIATGNDWRAVEAGIHAYAARSGRYQPITRWRRLGQGVLEGVFEGPVIVGVVGV